VLAGIIIVIAIIVCASIPLPRMRVVDDPLTGKPRTKRSDDIRNGFISLAVGILMLSLVGCLLLAIL
jgi:hypothetical protein